jgi:hypothetical protein
MICRLCDAEFDLNPARKYGRINECDDCASDVQKYTGVMVYGHKTAGTIQINSDPRLTQYMIDASPSNGSRSAMVRTRPNTSGAVYLPDEVSKGK